MGVDITNRLIARHSYCLLQKGSLNSLRTVPGIREKRKNGHQGIVLFVLKDYLII